MDSCVLGKYVPSVNTERVCSGGKTGGTIPASNAVQAEPSGQGREVGYQSEMIMPTRCFLGSTWENQGLAR